MRLTKENITGVSATVVMSIFVITLFNVSRIWHDILIASVMVHLLTLGLERNGWRGVCIVSLIIFALFTTSFVVNCWWRLP